MIYGLVFLFWYLMMFMLLFHDSRKNPRCYCYSMLLFIIINYSPAL